MTRLSWGSSEDVTLLSVKSDMRKFPIGEDGLWPRCPYASHAMHSGADRTLDGGNECPQEPVTSELQGQTRMEIGSSLSS
jgi:hypothetical protein